SHNWTDMVLRAFAVHPTRRRSKEAQVAAELLKSSFFKPDYYTSYQDERYWTRFMFWWPNILTALESLSAMGYSKDDPDIQKGLRWFVENQLPNGLWKLDYSKAAKETVSEEQLWLGLKIARLFKRFYG
ncbi:MAG: prenyltransferase/squalene oxidase repeat-containing protein, partial [Candidatus Bathyarchaeia archaeon]